MFADYFMSNLLHLSKVSNQASNQPYNQTANETFPIPSVNGKIEYHCLHNYVYGVFIAIATATATSYDYHSILLFLLLLRHGKCRYFSSTNKENTQTNRYIHILVDGWIDICTHCGIFENIEVDFGCRLVHILKTMPHRIVLAIAVVVVIFVIIEKHFSFTQSWVCVHTSLWGWNEMCLHAALIHSNQQKHTHTQHHSRTHTTIQ